MCLFTSSVTVTVKFSLFMMDLMIKISHEQYEKVTDTGYRLLPHSSRILQWPEPAK